MQAYLELLEIPQTSCDYYQAALTFNKEISIHHTA
jgi:D-alanine-D-alanine ligase